MSEAKIPFSSQDEIRTLFGTKDEYLRQVCDAVGVGVVVRDGEIRLQGSREQVERGREVLAGLQEVVRKTGRLRQREVDRALGAVRPGNNGSQQSGPARVGPVAHTESSAEKPFAADPSCVIDLHEKAKKVTPRSPGQAEYVEAIRKNDLVFASGPAGSGKTYLAVAMAVNALRTERVRKIVLVRPAVEAGEKLGFLPGDLLAKVNPYLRPLLDALNDLIGFEQVKRYMENDVIEIVPLAFMRGRTLNHTFIILDEGQNTTVTQMKMFLTRMGVESKIVVTGDTTQIDLAPNVTCGLTDAMNRLRNIKGVTAVRLTGRDIVRHRLVRDVVSAYEGEVVS